MKNKTPLKINLLQVVIVLSVLVGTFSCSDNSTKSITKDSAEDSNTAKLTPATKMDAKFLVQATVIDLEEIQLGQLAQQESKRTDIKELGQMMEESHTKNLHDLNTLADSKSIIIPTSLPDSAKDDYKQLQMMSDADFDKAYCDMMVNGHNVAIALFENASTESSDIDIRKWASVTLTDLHAHLDQAVKCQNKLGGAIPSSGKKK